MAGGGKFYKRGSFFLLVCVCVCVRGIIKTILKQNKIIVMIFENVFF